MKGLIIAAVIAVLLIVAQVVYQEVFGHPVANESPDSFWSGIDLWCFVVPVGLLGLFLANQIMGHFSGSNQSTHDVMRQGLDQLNQDAYRKAVVAQKSKSPEAGRIAREAERVALRGQIEYYTKYPDKDENGKSLRRAQKELYESEYYENS